MPDPPPKPPQFLDHTVKFPPVNHDVEIEQRVVEITIHSNDAFTASITSGQEFFSISSLSLIELRLVELEPGENKDI